MRRCGRVRVAGAVQGVLKTCSEDSHKFNQNWNPQLGLYLRELNSNRGFQKTEARRTVTQPIQSHLEKKGEMLFFTLIRTNQFFFFQKRNVS